MSHTNEDVVFFKVDIDESEDIVVEYNVTTLHYFHFIYFPINDTSGVQNACIYLAEGEREGCWDDWA